MIDDILDRLEAEREARAIDPMRPANPLLKEAAEEIKRLRAMLRMSKYTGRKQS